MLIMKPDVMLFVPYFLIEGIRPTVKMVAFNEVGIYYHKNPGDNDISVHLRIGILGICC